MTHLQKTAVVVGVCAAIALAVILYMYQDVSSSVGSADPAGVATSASGDLAAPAAQGNSGQGRVAEVLARRLRDGLDPARVAASLQKTMINQIADPQKVFAALPWLSEKQRHDGRGFIEYDPYVIETKFVGDQVDVFLPELGITATAVIDRVEHVDDDIIRWQGTFSNFSGGQNKFTLTQTLKDQYAVGTIETPMGNFNLESKNGYGWVVNQQADFYLPKDGHDTMEGKSAT